VFANGSSPSFRQSHASGGYFGQKSAKLALNASALIRPQRRKFVNPQRSVVGALGAGENPSSGFGVIESISALQ
jgi:hypothetical protein